MQLFLLTFLCMTIFASNSILCRTALITYGMGPLQYTALRGLCAAAMLAALCLAGIIRKKQAGSSTLSQAMAQSSWSGASGLFLYMLCFSLGYVNIPSAAGTLVLNTAVQFCMVGWGVYHGIYPGRQQSLGLFTAFIGLVWLVFPGLSSPPIWNAFLMACSGLAFGWFSLVGRRSTSAALATAGNFIRCVPAGLAVGAAALCLEHGAPWQAIACAVISGGVASSLGYILWYAIVPRYNLVASSIIQLSIPVITAVLAVFFLNEEITWHLVFCSALILGGICLATLAQRAKN
ncbi:MAG: DMT family transporter [Mailhella sp.]|nr:DMT family transporter [Mailhella sp.]